ncbi:hypothetical protein UA08_01558 [Talaromyces atroroseus]|uniref:Protein RTA1 n=1 Tax=Talaromyces atroroseus TaxID=1441469 RepID=A0A1Q5QC93_TALAT|nr:hypothetical protein UA08_01558 [Talaromyces atroroseus]OKL63501.1 hypothetical protein UA08_01558 [Talaromyces atroroseus]
MTASYSSFEFYHYNPSISAAVIFILLFLAATLLHLYQLFRTRAWFLIPFIVGGFFEWIGYVGRAISHTQTPDWTLGPYLLQTLLLLVAPALFAASIYMELGRIILLIDGESHALIKKKWLTKIFVCGDVLSFLMQAAGGGIQASGTASALLTGSHIIVGGLFIQLIFFGFFIFVAVHFDLNMKRYPTQRALTLPWRKHLGAMYATSLLIMVRSIFRVVEYLQGFDGYILEHEAFLYVFDALLMFLVMAVFIVVHPSEINALAKGGHAAKGYFGLEMTFLNGNHQHMPSDV